MRCQICPHNISSITVLLFALTAIPTGQCAACTPTQCIDIDLDATTHPRPPIAPPSAAATPLNATATRLAQHDSLKDHAAVPDPELYFQDQEDGSRLLIWPPDDTLPRDVLAGRPEAWLQTILPASAATVTFLPQFLEHYARLGFHPDRTLFTVHYDSSLPGGHASLNAVVDVLSAIGADYRIWRGEEDKQGHTHYFLSLLAMKRVPIKDWVWSVRSNELVDLRGLTSTQFLNLCELQGATWVKAKVTERHPCVSTPCGSVQECRDNQHLSALWKRYPLHGSLQQTGTPYPTKAVAFRGFLRPDATFQRILHVDEARTYFETLHVHCQLGQHEGTESVDIYHATENQTHHDNEIDDYLYSLTPYSRWWAFYKAPLMVGNAYLWHARAADNDAGHVTLHHFVNEVPQHGSGTAGTKTIECREIETLPPTLLPLLSEELADAVTRARFAALPHQTMTAIDY